MGWWSAFKNATNKTATNENKLAAEKRFEHRENKVCRVIGVAFVGNKPVSHKHKHGLPAGFGHATLHKQLACRHVRNNFGMVRPIASHKLVKLGIHAV
jgi:hypothetical protein